MNRNPNPNQFEDIVHGYFNICNRSITMMENINNRVSNILDTYCENVHQHAMNNWNTHNAYERTQERRRNYRERNSYRPISSIFDTTSIRQNPFSRSNFPSTFNNLPRNTTTPRVRINTRASTRASTGTRRNFSSQTFPNLTNFINNTLNTSTWSHSIPSARDISAATITARWWQLSGSTWLGPEPNNTTCPIRQRDFSDNDEIMMIRHCKHCFVKDSLMQWFQLDSRCPVCRWDIYNSANDISNNITRPAIPPPPPPLHFSQPPPPPPPTAQPNLSNIFRDDVLNTNNTVNTNNTTSLPTIPGVDRTTHNFLRNVTNTIETGLSNVLRNRGIDMSSNIVEASYTFSLPTPPSRGNVFNEETYHIRQQISPVTTRDNSNNIMSNSDDLLDNHDYH
tara:strand:+ start:69 stop:1253 length:1185 start_codon:yes stop_codon:yes gene_type:complete